jgi:hypothetical protein
MLLAGVCISTNFADEKKTDAPAANEYVKVSEVTATITRTGNANQKNAKNQDVKRPMKGGATIAVRFTGTKKGDEFFELTSDAVVRYKTLPPVTGPDGKPRKRTNDEISKKAGAGNFRGYPAELGDLKQNTPVLLQLVRPKGSTPNERPRVSTILILGEPPAGVPAKTKPPEKKKK